METIGSRRNTLVQLCRRLASRRGRSEPRILLEGPRLLREAEAAGLHLAVVVFSTSLLQRADLGVAATAARLEAAGTRVVGVPDAVMEALSPVDSPSGVVALADQPSAAADRVWRGAPPLVLLVSDVADPGNLGGLIRAAEAGGATGVICCGTCADPFGWKALRGAMGSAFRLPLAREPDLRMAVAAARAHALRVVATAPRAGCALHATDLRGPTALVLGGEAVGLAPDAVALADTALSIPMDDPVESLNVAVAGAIVVYEARRQRAGGDLA